MYAHRPELIRDYWNKFLINEHWMLTLPSKPSVILGNSVQKTAIDPRLIDTGLLVLGVPGAKPMGQELLLRRYLRTHDAPQTLFLYVDPEDTRDSLETILRYFVSFPEFVGLWRDLSWRERAAFLGRYFATLDLRSLSLTKREVYNGFNDEFIGEMLEGSGYLVSPNAARELSEDWLSDTHRQISTRVSFTARDSKYLYRILDLARERDIRVVLLSMVVPKELAVRFRENGFLADYKQFRTTVRLDYPEVVWEEPAITGLDRKLFGDHSHLNARGSRLQSSRFRHLYVAQTGVRETS